MTWYERGKPATSRGGFWLWGGWVGGGAGLLLLVRGYLFLPDTLGDHIVLVNLAVFIGILFFRFLFRSLADRNIGRIRALVNERPCLFSFQSWSSYGIMTMMIGLGVAVRAAALVALPGLGTGYIAMGVPLVMSSARLLREGGRSPHPTFGGPGSDLHSR